MIQLRQKAILPQEASA